MENKRGRKNDRMEEGRNTGRRDEKKEVKMGGRVDQQEEWTSGGGRGDEGEDGSRAVNLAAVCFFLFVVAQLPNSDWFLLFLECGYNVYFQLRERTQQN